MTSTNTVANSPTVIWNKLDWEQKYGCIVHDYPTNAKKIVEVFDTCIRPVIRELMKGENE